MTKRMREFFLEMSKYGADGDPGNYIGPAIEFLGDLDQIDKVIGELEAQIQELKASLNIVNIEGWK